ncbi:alpha/beta hydrolase [Paraburkholderia sp. MMS20-SJTN17]|uniref:Alpha/beta hydrolase n=1 Tax=Paraburkholderia translucens TaxID=2886945 RepID=A0ABS8K9X6_9BURK|nr:alpha/beta hydrolase [Paraburkholderia sp. MMS20-SJTN17]MCC8401477.1 alpha/beta hydrolase [Paraburkholderia sp. MMS20-SJTN17]
MKLHRPFVHALSSLCAGAVLCAASVALAATPVSEASPAAVTASAPDDAGPAYGPELQGFNYPAPVERFDFTSQGVPLQMAYMDVKPAHGNGRTVVLLHGKNFCSATWDPTIRRLSDAGYRVIAPDQIGFCKSSKPEHYQYSFQQLARNTHALLESLGVSDVTVVGHSTGGMLAIRYALMYPRETQQLVLVNPIGLEDWKAKGVPSLSVDQWYQRELKTSADGIRRYEQATYYAGQWRADYEPWVQMLAGMYRGPGKQIVAWNSALLYDMIYTQPVVYELGQLSMPTLLLIGQKDTTAIGKDAAPPEVRAKLGHYPELGRAAAKAIPHATLVEFPDLGHAPQMQDPDAFHKALLDGLAAVPGNR